MKSLIFTCLVLLTLVSTPTVKADVPKPKQPEKQAKYVLHSSLEVSTDPKANEAKLQITQAELKNLQAALGSAGSETPMAASIASSSARTIIAGLLLFLAVSIAGVLLARSSFGRRQKTVAGMILVLAVVGAAAIITRGNAGPPGSFRWRNLPQSLAEGRTTIGGLDIEIIPENTNSGAGMRLIIPLQKQNTNGEE